MTRKTTLEFKEKDIIDWIKSKYGYSVVKITSIVPLYDPSEGGYRLEITFTDENSTNE